MNNSKSEELQRKLAAFIYQRLDKIEIYVGVVLLIAFLANVLTGNKVGAIYTVSLTTLAICYALSAYNKYEGINKLQLFFLMIGSYALSVGAVGILFFIKKWPGGNMMAIMGLIGSLISLIGLTVDRMRNKEEDYKVSIRWLIRLALMSFLLIALRVVNR